MLSDQLHVSSPVKKFWLPRLEEAKINWLVENGLAIFLVKRKTISRSGIAAVLLCACCSSCHSQLGADGPDLSAQKRATSPLGSKSPAPPVTWDEITSAYDRLSDYVCLYEKEEKAISDGEQQTMRLSFRKPFDIRIEWLNDKGVVDQTAVYRQGFNDGKVLARQSGLLGALAGKLRLDPNDPLALSDSKHPITEAGLGKIIEHAARDVSDARVATHFVSEEVLDNRDAFKFEFTSKGEGDVNVLAGARKGVVWIDKELKLPVKVEFYDDANVLLERHRFKDIHVNTKLADKVFTL